VKHHTHLLEERLFDCYLAETAGEPLDPRLADHLADCGPCAARYADLAAFMDDLRAQGAHDAEQIFTPDRLRHQHQQIMRRIAHAAQPARVISFPERIVRRTMNRSFGGSRTAPRWIAAAAAAGLFIGVAVGASFQFAARERSTATQTLARQTPSRSVSAGPRVTAAQIAADDAFLSDLEVALERPHTRELLAFDALTPHVREVQNR
jgi:hypothetical protein